MKHSDNSVPKKQGSLYSLYLGQKNGPYLSKDIMLTNYKSLKLLGDDALAKNTANILLSTAANVMQNDGGANALWEPEDVYDTRHNAYINYDERYRSKLSGTNNMNTREIIQEQNLTNMRKELDDYKKLISQYKDELKKLNEMVNAENSDNSLILQPMLHDFQSKLKDKVAEEKNEKYRLQREYEQLTRDKQQIQKQILFSHKRVQELEKMCGIEEQVSDDESGSEEDDYYDEDDEDDFS